MFNRDIIKDQIEQVGRALAKIAAALLDLKIQGNISQGIEMAEAEFKEELNLDIDELLAMEKVELTKFLKDNRFGLEQIENLYFIAYEMGKYKMKSDPEKAKEILSQLETIIETFIDHTGTASMDLLEKLDKLKHLNT